MAIEPKYLYAAYLNMAKNNVRTALSYIHQSIVGSSVTNLLSPDKLLEEIQKSNQSAETQQRVISLFEKHFPFVAALFPGDAAYEKNLQCLIKQLERLRNEYTHTVHDERKPDENIIKGMKSLFDAARRRVIERLQLSDADVRHLDRYKLDDANGNLTDKGLAFFVCLFLEKKYANLLLGQISGFKRTDEKCFRATKEVYSVYRLQLPKCRIDSKEPDMALGLDMLNELKKCPKELWDLLSRKDQQTFRIPVGEVGDSDDASGMEALLRRSQDRFPVFALNYIDQKHCFNELRFQVSLGTYRFKFYDKTTVDDKPKVRILQKPIYGYGRLKEMDERRTNKTDGLGNQIRQHSDIVPDTADTEPYMTDSKARYIISNNRIGLHIGDYMPTLDAPSKQPDCWLSIYELPPMIFHRQISKDNETEEIIIKHIGSYRKLFQDIADGVLQPDSEESVCTMLKDKYHLEFKRIPKEMQNYLTNNAVSMEQEFNRQSEDRINTMRKETMDRQQRIKQQLDIIHDRKRNKIGTRRYVEIKSGKLADFLAEDMMRFQPTANDGKDKITGVNYQTLQASIAYYGQYKDEMERIFRNCKLIDSEIAHPFLPDVMKACPADIVSFYKAYLTERLKYLDKCIKSGNYKSYAFLHADRIRWQERNTEFYKDLARRYLQLPIDLPRGLFAEPIKEILLGDENMKSIVSQDRVNTSYLIMKWFACCKHDDSQAFYKFKRNYELFDRLNNRDASNRLQKSYYTLDELNREAGNLSLQITEYTNKYKGDDHEKEAHRMQRLRHQYVDTEKLIRLYRIEDILLFVMAKDILISEPEIEDIERYKLQEIKPDSDSDILSAQTAIQIKVRFGNTDFVIKQDNLKIKNYGDFKRFLHDSKMPSLLKFYNTPDIPIDRTILEDELAAYDKQRVPAFQLLHEFEDKVLKAAREVRKKDGYVKFPEVLKHSPLSKDEQESLNAVRKAFCHNTYPDPNDKIAPKSDFPHIAEKLVVYIEQSVSNVH
ncbi:MAG: type VI-B CRISPR-associated RNA-guided ribonuclease Cas13b [Prevotellaceae bacterium]|nr:type VI-B CRISPR-associated RNA-guided ribonuclease Cas13b [Prevotellaceae bacterium]